MYRTVCHVDPVRRHTHEIPKTLSLTYFRSPIMFRFNLNASPMLALVRYETDIMSAHE